MGKVLEKVYSLNNRVVLFRRGDYIFVTEGLFTGLGAFFSIIFFILYQASIVTNPVFWVVEIFFILGFGMIGSRGLSAIASFYFTVRDPKRVRYPGFIYYGGMIGGLFGSIIFALLFGYNPLAIMDGAAIGAAISEAIGKIGCFTYGCCWGKPTSKKWGVRFKNPLSKVNRFKYKPGQKLYPTQLMQSAQLFFIFIVLLLFTGFQRVYGHLTAVYFILHGAFRLFIEHYRADTTKVTDKLTLTGIISITIMIAGVLMLLLLAQPVSAPVTLNWWVLTNPWTYLAAIIGFLIAGVPMSIHYKKVGSW